jgi:hypothetical protein
MLASGTQVQGFKPGRIRRIFQGEKIHSMPCFCRLSHVADLQHVKETYNDVEVAIVV